MPDKRFKVGGLITSTNKQARGFNIVVFAPSKRGAENAAKTKMKRKHPHDHVTIGKVQED